MTVGQRWGVEVDLTEPGDDERLLAAARKRSGRSTSSSSTARGRILAVGSSGISTPLPNLGLSNLGRAMLAGYLMALAAEVAADGVTVNPPWRPSLWHVRRHRGLVSPLSAEACVHVMPCAAGRRWGRREPGTTRSGAGGR